MINSFFPHRWCMANNPAILTFYFASNMTLFICYTTLAVLLLLFAWTKRGEFIAAFHALFSGFVFLCGLTHAMEAITLYYPIYAAETVTLCVTALFSVAALTAVLKNYVKLKNLPRRSTLEKNIAEEKNNLRTMQMKFSEKFLQVKYYRDLHKHRKTAH